MESSLITSIGALVMGGSAAALFWKPLMAGIAAIVTSNRAGGEIITSYKEQVMMLKEEQALLRQENDALRIRHDASQRLISGRETDLKLIKNALALLLSLTESDQSDRLHRELTRLIATLEDRENGRDQV